MTDARTPSDRMISLDELPPAPDVALHGPGQGQAQLSAATAIDGVAVIFFDPTTNNPHVVFVSDGLAGLLDRPVVDLLGQSPLEMFHQIEGPADLTAIRRALVADPVDRTGFDPAPAREKAPRMVDLDLMDTADISADLDRGGAEDIASSGESDFDIDLGHDPAPTRTHTMTQSLRHDTGKTVLVQATYTTVPSMTPTAPYVVAQFQDLSKASAESLLADQAAVIGSLSRGHELGRLCHQISSQVEGELGDGSRCWIGVVDAADNLEPVTAGDLPFDTVAAIMRSVAAAGSPSLKRVVPADGLPPEQAALMRSHGLNALWYVPMIGTDGGVRGAMLVATGHSQPDGAITRSLDHLSVVMATAVDHATVEADIAHQTLHDPLTRLPNRALIVDRLGQAMARLERDGIALSVLLVDIDRFRTVNDTRGAEVGDQVLLEVASRLLAAVRLGDTVGRISSDQYMVMCVATSGELDAAAVARRILRSLSTPIGVPGGADLHITASVGVVVVDEPGLSPAVIIGNAESALARASGQGRGQMAMFEADLRRHVVDRHETEQALHRAITNNELAMHYQPLVEIRTGFMVGAEALVRWERPGHGLLYPPSFIQIAEESELILPMGNWIIDQVCADLGRWPKSNGRSPMVTINLAAGQLAVDTLVPTVVSALQRNGLHPARVGFEITESMEIRDLEAASINLNRLSELGCRIAIDDFGIGHATLAYIRQFSMADALKIDRSFVDGLGRSREDTAIVNASIALADSLGLQVIAEGVENVEQLATLQDLGCRYAQGFGLSKPISFEDVLELWTRSKLYDPDKL